MLITERVPVGICSYHQFGWQSRIFTDNVAGIPTEGTRCMVLHHMRHQLETWESCLVSSQGWGRLYKDLCRFYTETGHTRENSTCTKQSTYETVHTHKSNHISFKQPNQYGTRGSLDMPSFKYTNRCNGALHMWFGFLHNHKSCLRALSWNMKLINTVETH